MLHYGEKREGGEIILNRYGYTDNNILRRQYPQSDAIGLVIDIPVGFTAQRTREGFTAQRAMEGRN